MVFCLAAEQRDEVSGGVEEPLAVVFLPGPSAVDTGEFCFDVFAVLEAPVALLSIIVVEVELSLRAPELVGHRGDLLRNCTVDGDERPVGRDDGSTAGRSTSVRVECVHGLVLAGDVTCLGARLEQVEECIEKVRGVTYQLHPKPRVDRSDGAEKSLLVNEAMELPNLIVEPECIVDDKFGVGLLIDIGHPLRISHARGDRYLTPDHVRGGRRPNGVDDMLVMEERRGTHRHHVEVLALEHRFVALVTALLRDVPRLPEALEFLKVHVGGCHELDSSVSAYPPAWLARAFWCPGSSCIPSSPIPATPPVPMISAL